MNRASKLYLLSSVATRLRACGACDHFQSGRQGRLPLLGGTRRPDVFVARPEAALHLFALLVGLFLFAGCQTAPKLPDYQPLVARFCLEIRPGEAGVPVQLPKSGVGLTINAKPVLVEYDIINAEVAHVDLGNCLLLQLTPAASRELYRMSVTHLGERLVLFLNDIPVGARRIEQAMADGVVLVFLETPEADLPGQVARIKRTAADIVLASAKKK